MRKSDVLCRLLIHIVGRFWSQPQKSYVLGLGVSRGRQGINFIGSNRADLALTVALIFKDIGNNRVLKPILHQINC